jgi:hypothetical protein
VRFALVRFALVHFVVVLGQSLPDAKDDSGRCVLLPTNPRAVRHVYEGQ